jgi:hypothetical protein
VSIEIRCENCGNIVRAPRSRAGKRADCPGCGHSIYIPSPPEELEELTLTPEDPEELKREARLQAERRELDRRLLREEGWTDGVSAADREPAAFSPSGATPGRGEARSDTEEAVLSFLTAMRDSDLARAEHALETLRPQSDAARDIIERLAADQIPPPEMADVPPAVYQGFLKKLRSQL